MDYVAMGQIITDDVVFPGKRPVRGQLGGVGYALAGMRVWSDSVGLCGRVGADFERLHGRWFHENKIDLRGARITAQRGPHSTLNYFEDGEREEISVSGCASIASMMPLPEEMPKEYRGCRGLYLFKDADAAYWKLLADYLLRYPTTVLWEILGETASPQNARAIQSCLPYTALFSINLTEGRRLCQTDEPLDIVRELSRWGAGALLLRMGASGALVAEKGRVWRIPAVPTAVVDVTGGGNSSSGGFLAGYCETGGDIAAAGKWAAVSASLVLEQYGVPERLDGRVRRTAQERAAVLGAQRIR